MKRVIIAGSPRSNGRSAHLAEMLFEASIDERPEDELYLAPVSELEIGPCIGCDGCRKLSDVVFATQDGGEEHVSMHRCVFNDDMQDLYDQLDDADELVIVSPVFFSGAPAPMKALLDRLQPYFWSRIDARRERDENGTPLPPKRPATLHIVGEGDNPYGHDALIAEVRSSIALANFSVERILDWVGKIDKSGEITGEAEVTELEQVAPAAGRAQAEEGKPEGGAKKQPKLNLHATRPKQQPSQKQQASGQKPSQKQQASGQKRKPAQKQGQSQGRKPKGGNGGGKKSRRG